MINIPLEKVAEAAHGKLCNASFANELFINGVSIDTRDDQTQKLFVPLKGTKVDGHDFLEVAYNKGAGCVLTEKEIDTNKPYILVDSTFQALKDFAKYYRSLFDIPVIGITGSVGKTTTKDLTASILSQKYKTLKTEGNFNNEIGLPLTIFRLDQTIEVLVLEMGMNNFGEMHNLSEIAKPSICLITNIGEAHIENLGSREGILKAKSEIFDYMDRNGKIILNGDDDMLITLKSKLNNPYFYYLNKSEENFTAFDIEYKGIESVSSKLKIAENEFIVDIPVAGEHMVYNAIAAAMIGKFLRLQNSEIQQGIAEFELSKNRMEIININNRIIINDVYNSSPKSVKSVIDILCNHSGRKVCVLGDMFELGHHADGMHYDVGRYAAKKNIDLIICIGRLSAKMFEGANENIESSESQQAIYFDSLEKFLDESKHLFKDGDAILVKASRGMSFENIIKKLIKEV